MKKILYFAIILTIIAFIPVMHQEATGCSAFAYEHLVSPSVISTADSCLTSILAIPFIPSIQLSLFFPFNSVYLNYIFLGITSFFFYLFIGWVIMKLLKNKLEA